MSTNKSADELPRKEIAKKVITSKQRYFFPETGQLVEATDIPEATAILDSQKEEQADESRKEGDGN